MAILTGYVKGRPTTLYHREKTIQAGITVYASVITPLRSHSMLCTARQPVLYLGLSINRGSSVKEELDDFIMALLAGHVKGRHTTLYHREKTIQAYCACVLFTHITVSITYG